MGVTESAYEAEIAAWRREREDSLVRDDGWLTQIDLHWLADEPLLLDIGTFTACPEGAQFIATKGIDVRRGGASFARGVVADDLHSANDILSWGTRTYQVVRRGDGVAVRVRDREAPARRAFRGLEWYPAHESWRVVGRIERTEPQTARMRFTLGQTEDAPVPGRIIFAIDGREAHLTPYARTSGELLIVFRDRTNVDTTCELCRYFYAPPPDADGSVVLDFNKAAAPVCAFVPSVTCVLPPPDNNLPFRIEAGEKRYR